MALEGRVDVAQIILLGDISRHGHARDVVGGNATSARGGYNGRRLGLARPRGELGGRSGRGGIVGPVGGSREQVGRSRLTQKLAADGRRGVGIQKGRGGGSRWRDAVVGLRRADGGLDGVEGVAILLLPPRRMLAI